MLDFKRTMSKTGLAYIIILGGSLIMQVGLSNLAYIFFPQLLNSYAFLVVINALPIYLLGLSVYLAIIRKMPDAPEPSRRKISIGRFFLLLIFSVGAMYFCNMISNVLVSFISFLKGSAVLNPLQAGVENGGFVFNVLYVTIAAPVFEELIFRKMAWRAVGKYGERIYVIISAAIFGAFHGNLSQILYAFVLGVIFAMIYSRTGRLLYCILLHMSLNLIGSIIVPHIVLNGGNNWAAVIYGLIVLAIIYTGVTLALYGRSIHLQDNGDELPPFPIKSAFSSVGIVIYLLCAAALTIIMTVIL